MSESEPTGAPQEPGALYLYAITRARSWRGGSIRLAEETVQRVRYRDLDALVRPTPYERPSLEDGSVQRHQRVVEAAMRRGTVLPAPFGIVFRGRRQLIGMLQDQYLVLEEGLSYFDGYWELRLHITPTGSTPEADDPEASDVAMALYSELRSQVRAAVPFPADGRRLLSAAFLVERDAWIEFMDRIGELDAAHPEVSFDVTGPWPPYDFIRIAT